jgi:hypothetical protein
MTNTNTGKPYSRERWSPERIELIRVMRERDEQWADIARAVSDLPGPSIGAAFLRDFARSHDIVHDSRKNGRRPVKGQDDPAPTFAVPKDPHSWVERHVAAETELATKAVVRWRDFLSICRETGILPYGKAGALLRVVNRRREDAGNPPYAISDAHEALAWERRHERMAE